MIDTDYTSYKISNEKDYTYTSNSNISDINDSKVRDICDLCFIDNDNFFKKINNQEVESGYNFRPVFSYYNGNNNYILFVGSVSFWLIQRVSFAFCIIFIEEKIIVHRGKKDNKLSLAIEDINYFVEKGLVLLENPYLYLINGYSRPYHYFYDTMQTYSYGDLSVFSKYLDLEESAYLPSSVLGISVNSETVSQNEVNNYLLEENAVGFTASSIPSVKNISFIEEFSDCMLTNIDSKNIENSNSSNNKFIIWIGLCQESRQWVEQKESIIRLIKELNDIHKNIFLVFDGLTCPHYLDSINFLTKKCSKETRLLDSIIKESGLTSKDFISLIGAKAIDKISISHSVNFFISDALTDSIWPASFGKKPGVAYSIERAKTVHFHPKTFFIPNENIKEIGDGTGNWARVNFSIDPDFFVKFTMDTLSKTIAEV